MYLVSSAPLRTRHTSPVTRGRAGFTPSVLHDKREATCKWLCRRARALGSICLLIIFWPLSPDYNSTFAASGGESASQSELVPCGPLISRKSGWPRIWEAGGREGSVRRRPSGRNLTVAPLPPAYHRVQPMVQPPAATVAAAARTLEKSTRPARPSRPKTVCSISLVPTVRKCSATPPSFHAPPNSCASTVWSTRPRVSSSPSSLPG